MKTKAILSPCLLIVDNTVDDLQQRECVADLMRVVTYVAKYMSNSVEIDCFKGSMYFYYGLSLPNYAQGSSYSNFMNAFLGQIQKLLSGQVVDLSAYHACVLPDEYILPDNTYSEIFKRYLTYIAEEKFPSLVFLGRTNYDINPSLNICEMSIPLIADMQNEIYEEFNELFPIDNTESSFPRRMYCRSCNDIIKHKCCGLDHPAKRAIYIKYGTIIAKRNKYSLDNELSNKNSKTQHGQRKVFVSNNSNYYLTLDFESGGFELFDKHGRHCGQYDFSCNKVKDADAQTHPLYLR